MHAPQLSTLGQRLVQRFAGGVTRQVPRQNVTVLLATQNTQRQRGVGGVEQFASVEPAQEVSSLGSCGGIALAAPLGLALLIGRQLQPAHQPGLRPFLGQPRLKVWQPQPAYHQIGGGVVAHGHHQGQQVQPAQGQPRAQIVQHAAAGHAVLCLHAQALTQPGLPDLGRPQPAHQQPQLDDAGRRKRLVRALGVQRLCGVRVLHHQRGAARVALRGQPLRQPAAHSVRPSSRPASPAKGCGAVTGRRVQNADTPTAPSGSTRCGQAGHSGNACSV